MAHLWAEPNPPSLRDVPEHHRLAGPPRDWKEEISEPEDAVLQPPTPGPVGSGGKEKMGLMSDEEQDEKERDRGKPDTVKRSFSASASSSSSDSQSNKRNRTRRPHSPATGAGNRPDDTGGAGGTSIERMRPRPSPKSKSRPILEPLEIQVEHHDGNGGGTRSRSGSPRSASPSSRTQHLTAHNYQHDGDYVDSPVSDSRPSSRLTDRSLEQVRDRHRGLGRPEGGENQGAENGATPIDSTAAPTLTSTPMSLGIGGAGEAVGINTGTGGHARTISTGSGKGIGMTGRQELVRRALADGHGHGHGHVHANGHHQGSNHHGYVHPKGRTIEPSSPHGSAGVPFPTMASNLTTSFMPSSKPRTDAPRRLPLDLSIDVDLASRPPARTRRTTSSSRSPSSSRHGSTPHSPVLPNGSVGIGPALGIAKAGARLRAIVDDADQDAWASSGSASPPILGRQSRSRASSLKSVPRRRMTDQGASGSSTPTATPITPGLSGSSIGTRPSGLNEGAMAARRRAKSLMSPASSRPDERELGRGSSSRRVEMGTRKRSSTARVRTIPDLKREREREIESGEARQGRRRGATVHFPPTPMEDGVEDQFMVETGTNAVGGRLKGLSNGGDRELTSEGSKRRETSTARPTSDNNSSLPGRVGSDTEREDKRRQTRSRLGDESSDDETTQARRSRKGKEKARDRGRNRNGFEQVFETERSGHGDDADPLQTLLASVDINNALRLISQTTLIPGGRQAVLPGMGSGLAAEKSLTTGFTPTTPYKNGNGGRIGTSKGRPSEVFVAKAPPSVTASPAYVGGEDNRLHDAESVRAKNKLIDRAGQKKNKVSAKIEESLKGDVLDSPPEKAFFDGRAKIRSRRGTMIERDFVRPEAGDLSRTATAQSGDHERAISSDEEDLDRVSSSIGHGGYEGTVRDDRSNRSEPHSNGSVSQAFRPITPELRTESKPVEKPANATPESTKRKRLSGLFHLRHSRSSSSSKWRTDPKAKDKSDPIRDSAAREAAERDAAEHEAKVQSVLLSLPSHPRCEALAYQARSHFQAYYGLMIRSLEDAAERPGQPYLRWNPLRVIRWRKQVLAEEKRRQNWDGSVNEQIKSHHRLVQSTDDDGIPRDGWESQVPDSIGRAGSRLQQMSKVISPPLRSATALSRALASDPQAAMALRKSATFKEWLVLPSEILAFLDCRGNVDYFVPATDEAQDVLRMAMANVPYPQSDGLPLSRPTKSAFPVQQGLSSGSYGSSQGNISTVSFDSETLEHDPIEDGVQKRKSVTRRMWASTHLSRHQSNTSKESDHGERFTHVLKSPIDAIRRRVLHHESDMESDSERDLRNRDRRSSHSRHGRLRKLAHPDRYQNGRGSLDAATSQAEDLAHDAAVSSRKSSIAPIAESLGGQTDLPDGGDFVDKKLGWSHIEGTAVENSPVKEMDNKPESDAQRDEEYTKHEALIRNTDTLLAKLFVDLAPVPITFSQTLEVFQQGIVHINRAAGLHVDVPHMPDELVARGKADFLVPTQPTSQFEKPMGSRTLSTRGSLQSSTDVLPGLQAIRSRRSVTVTGGRATDPVAALEQTVNNLSTQFDAALPQAITLAQQQDDLQDKVSLMTTRAEQLRMKLDAEGNGKIRRQRAHLQSMRMPTERSIDHWSYELLRYLLNTSLAVFRVGVYVKRFILWIAYLIQQIVMVVFRWMWAIVTSVIEMGRYILGGWVIRTILLLAIWSVFLLYFFVED